MLLSTLAIIRLKRTFWHFVESGASHCCGRTTPNSGSIPRNQSSGVMTRVSNAGPTGVWARDIGFEHDKAMEETWARLPPASRHFVGNPSFEKPGSRDNVGSAQFVHSSSALKSLSSLLFMGYGQMRRFWLIDCIFQNRQHKGWIRRRVARWLRRLKWAEES